MTKNRQQPGYSCEECRRRKARCDRVRPTCGNCAETGTKCVVSHNRPARGPKKGQLKALRSRVAMLESQLSAQADYHSDPGTMTPNIDPGFTDSMFDDLPILDASTFASDAIMGSNYVSGSDEETLMDRLTPELSYAPSAASVTSGMSNGCTDPTWHTGALPYSGFADIRSSPRQEPSYDIATLTSSMKSELDQLYFERFHAVAPIIQRQRYFSWAGQESPSWPRACLRSAMRTVAAAMSVGYRRHSQTLYSETRRLLKDSEAAQISDELGWSPYGARLIPIEQIQALLLLAHYELLCHNQQKAMLTAGRVFRMVQMARLYELDKMDVSMATSDGFVTTEEKRRTFWLAFSFDRFLCARDDLQPTLHEEMISTRLPAPEANFQQNIPILPKYLSEAMASSDSSHLSPFAECMVIATIYGRCASHRRQSLVAMHNQPGQDADDFWTRHEWIAGSLEGRIQMLEQGTRHTLIELDPMVHFTYTLAQSAMIHLHGTVRMCPWYALDYQHLANAYEERAHIAALELIRLTYAVASLSSLKAHIFLPNALSCCADFLAPQNKSGEVSPEGLGQVMGVLRGLKETNNLARDFLQLLENDLPMGAGLVA